MLTSMSVYDEVPRLTHLQLVVKPIRKPSTIVENIRKHDSLNAVSPGLTRLARGCESRICKAIDLRAARSDYSKTRSRFQ
jgi:hypothetical protein